MKIEQQQEEAAKVSKVMIPTFSQKAKAALKTAKSILEFLDKQEEQSKEIPGGSRGSQYARRGVQTFHPRSKAEGGGEIGERDTSGDLRTEIERDTSGDLLKQNAILPYNDAILEYFKMSINQVR